VPITWTDETMIYNQVMTKDKRQIHLDPMEWRDAMKKVPGKAPPKKAPAKNRAPKAIPPPRKKG
jgi:hypothetical protein